MGIPAILESAIALFFIFLIVSIIVTATNELIASALRLRAANLRKGIEMMMSGNAEVTTRLFLAPHIALSTKDSKRGPSYLDAGNFSESLCDFITTGGKYLQLGVHYMDGFNLSSAIAASDLPDQPKALVLSFARSAENDVKAFKARLGQWFDQTMERVSGWYNRTMRWISFGLGLAIAVGVNIDTIVLTSRFTSSASDRAAVVAQAVDLYANQKISSLPAPLSDQVKSSINSDIASLETRGIIGWGADVRLFAYGSNAKPSPWDIALKVIGFLATAIAASLGAPFWFDLLNRLVNMRSSLTSGGAAKPSEKAAADSAAAQTAAIPSPAR